MVKDRIVTTGETYFLFRYDGYQLVTSSIVKLIDSFYYNNQVYLLLADLLTDEVLLRNYPLNKDENRCQCKLFDANTLRDILFAKNELKYHERNIHTDNDLLEFDYK